MNKMKIITVPDNKKIKQLSAKNDIINEGFFDMAKDEGIFSDENEDMAQKELTRAYQKLAEEELIPEVKDWLSQYGIKNYEIICTGHGIVVDVHDHLYLANWKFISLPDSFSFRTVDGNVNFANNRFTTFKYFPRYIKGDCIATFNKITDFSNAPEIWGSIFAEKQRVRTKYPLTQENYEKWKNETLDENCTRVHITTTDEYGILKNINEKENYAEVLIEGGTFNKDQIKKIPLVNVDVIDGIKLLNDMYK